MHKRRTFNIAAVCLVVILVVFVLNKKNTTTDSLGNITTEGGMVLENQKNTDEYQQQILQAIIDQNIKTFETISDSFKRKPTDSLSETIAKNTFAEYIKYNTTDTIDVNKITAETVAALKEHPVEKSNVTIRDIKLSGNDITSLREYVNNISVVQTQLTRYIYEVRNKKDIQIYIKNLYKTTSNLYKRIPVPQSLAKEHINIINGYANYSIGFGLLELQTTDPARALSGVQTVKEAQDLLVTSFSSIKKIVSLNNIVYTEKDPAYVWFLNATGTETIKTN